MLIMASNSPNPLLFVLGGLAMAGGVYTYWYIQKEREKKEREKRERERQEREKKELERRKREANETAVHPVQPEKKEDAPTVAENLTDEALAQQAKLMIKYFSGYMNALSDIINDGDLDETQVTFENLTQTIEAHGTEVFKKWFSDFAKDRKIWDKALCQEKAGKMFDILKACGIQNSTAKQLQWNEIAEEHYRKLDKIEHGEICEVLAPCWIYDHKVFEKGLVRRIKK